MKNIKIKKRCDYKKYKNKKKDVIIKNKKIKKGRDYKKYKN